MVIAETIHFKGVPQKKARNKMGQGGGPKTGNQYLKGEAEELTKEIEASDSDRRDKPRTVVFREAGKDGLRKGLVSLTAPKRATLLSPIRKGGGGGGWER